ncbi:MAG: anhydro-N-acetylmuramic acid kinase [Flavobacteriaceae bacterium]|nr:anhydro-N-acetylmuramic acid kinase [Flavobacteriaceae bacterium]
MKQIETFCIGLMSGTSLDGVDLVYCRFLKNQDLYSFSIISSKTYPYSEEWLIRLVNAFNEDKSSLDILDNEYGEYLGLLINKFIAEFHIDAVDLIASHGHTIFHKPEEGFTLQIGNGAIISKLTGQKVICDFRSQDVAFGGQGAPLVPIGDALLFSNYEYCLNLGGFANISFDQNGSRKAFDICPVNIVMNHYAKKLGFTYDDKGVIASKGVVNVALLKKLNSLPFFVEIGPKSLGFEFVVQEVFPLIDGFRLSESDVLATYIAHVTDQVSKKIIGKGQVLLTGGGAFNLFLIEELQKKCEATIITRPNELVNFKEAVVFAFLGLLRDNEVVNCLKSVTGASEDHCSGVVFTPD